MDWNEEWNRSIRLTSRARLNAASFWDDRVRSCGPGHFPEELTKDQIHIIRPEREQRILEIGPGVGRLTLPLARSSLEVTVVDPSVAMLNILKERSQSEGLSNVKVHNDYWEQIDTGFLGRYDKLVSSFSLFMYDIGWQLARMDAIADAVFLFVPADHRIPYSIQELLFGKVRVMYTDHVILSRLTNEMGYHPDTFTIDYPNNLGFSSLEEAGDYYCDIYCAPASFRGSVIERLASSMEERSGRYYMGHSRSVGVICWQKG
jgi:SAM-dependent methyltransferase